MPKVSVIVPVYNVEKYIERCAVSLFEQTLDDIEYIFVNDCTPDNSMAVLDAVMQRYPDRKNQVKIVTMDRNSGQAMVRNAGVEQATGDYVIHCDSDDWVESDIYEKLYNKAIESGADIVVCDYIHEYKDRNEIKHYEKISQPIKCLMSSGFAMYYVWNRLVRYKLIEENRIRFIHELNYGEDLCFMYRLYYYANRIAYIDKPLYHYNQTNENSIVQSISDVDRIEQMKRCYDHLEIFFAEKKIALKMIKAKINIRDSWLCTSDNDKMVKWKSTYPEVVSIVTADKSLKWSYRWCYTLASKGFFMPLKLYMLLSRTK